MSALTQRNLALGLVLGLFLLGLNGVLSHLATQRLVENDGRLLATYDFTQDLAQVLSTVQDAETGQRGYLLTGRYSYLEPYHRALSSLSGQRASLRRKALGDRETSREIALLERQIDVKLAELEQTVELRRTAGLAAALQVVDNDVGKHTMDDIRARVEELDRDSKTRLERRREESRASAREATATLWPAPLVASAVDSLRPAAAAKAITLTTELDPETGPIWGDPTRLQQVVWNLVSNAVKFTPKEGRVDVRLQRVRSFVEIAVLDTGVGISAEFLPDVFDRFRQADSSTTRQHGGLGLGLSIVRHLVELHGGTVDATSEGVGCGATFTVRLPIRAVRRPPVISRMAPLEAAPAVAAISPEAAAALVGSRVMIVDDEPDAVEMLAVLLAGCGAEIKVARSAAEALATLAEWQADVLVSDIGMPLVDGYELIRQVRALPPDRCPGLPAIALSAHARAEDRIHALAAGFQAHVAKPVDQTELVLVAASLVRRGR